MAERKIRSLDYDTVLTLEEARARYTEVEQAFSEVERRYSSILKDDLKALSNCIGVLLPLGMNASVQGEVRGTEKIEETLFSKIAELQTKVMLFSAKFENSGVKKMDSGGMDF